MKDGRLTEELTLLPPERFAEVIPLFNNNEQPNRPIAFSVLEGRVPGQVYVDTACLVGQQPRTCLILAPWGFCFVAGELSASRVAAIESLLWEIRSVGLCVPAMLSPSLNWMDPQPLHLQRCEFLNAPDDTGSLAKLASVVPEGYSIVPITDSVLFEHCISRDSFCGAYGGSVERLLQSAVIHAMMDSEGAIVSEAYAGLVGGGMAEIGVVTRKGYEGRGLATVVCAHLLLALTSTALIPYWSCDAGNQASAAVARKLGFIEERLYDIFVFYQEQAA